MRCRGAASQAQGRPYLGSWGHPRFHPTHANARASKHVTCWREQDPISDRANLPPQDKKKCCLLRGRRAGLAPVAGTKAAGPGGCGQGLPGRGQQTGRTGLRCGRPRSSPNPAGPAADGLWPWTLGSLACEEGGRGSPNPQSEPPNERPSRGPSKGRSLCILHFLTRQGPHPPLSLCGGSGERLTQCSSAKTPHTPGSARYPGSC